MAFPAAAIAALVGIVALTRSQRSTPGDTVLAPRVIDASGVKPKLLPIATAAKPKPKKKTGAAKPMGRVKAKAKPTYTVDIGQARLLTPAEANELRSDSAAAQPTGVKPSTPHVQNKRRAQGSALSAALRDNSPPMPKAGQAKVPAPKGTDLALAKKTAADVAQHIRKFGTKYKHDVLKRWQVAAGCHKPDGLYGPYSASALSYWGAAAPRPLFKGQDVKYVPPTQGV